MGVAVFRPCCLNWGLTMVWIMKVIGTFFKRTWASTLVSSAHHPDASHSWTMPLPETPGHSQVWLSWTLTSLAQSAVGTLILLLAPGEQKVLFVPSNCLFQTCGNSIIKSNWPIRSNSLRVLSPFARSHAEKSVVVLKLPYLYKNFFRKIILQLADCALGHF